MKLSFQQQMKKNVRDTFGTAFLSANNIHDWLPSKVCTSNQFTSTVPFVRQSSNFFCHFFVIFILFLVPLFSFIFILCHSQCPRQPERTPYQLIAAHSWATFSAAPDSDQCSRRPRRRKASWEHHRKRPLPGPQYYLTLFQCSPWSDWIRSPLWRGRNCYKRRLKISWIIFD